MKLPVGAIKVGKRDLQSVGIMLVFLKPGRIRQQMQLVIT